MFEKLHAILMEGDKQRRRSGVEPKNASWSLYDFESRRRRQTTRPEVPSHPMALRCNQPEAVELKETAHPSSPTLPVSNYDR